MMDRTFVTVIKLCKGLRECNTFSAPTLDVHKHHDGKGKTNKDGKEPERLLRVVLVHCTREEVMQSYRSNLTVGICDGANNGRAKHTTTFVGDCV